MHDYSKRRGSRTDLKFAHATLLEKGGYPGSQNHVAANGEWCVHQKIEPVRIVGGFLEPKRHMSLFNPQAWYFLSAYKNVNVAKPDAAVSDEGGIERVKVGYVFGAGDVSGAERQEDDEDSADYGRVKPYLGQ